MSDALNVSSEVVALAERLKDHHWRLATAESCTGGLIAASCTALSGSSDWFERGFVTYSNASKTEMLGVDAALIAQHGAVSEAVARAMAEGALAHSHADIAVAVTGVAGPDGGTPDKPVGTVWFAWQVGDQLISEMVHFGGDRHAIRQSTVAHALHRLVQHLQAVSRV